MIVVGIDPGLTGALAFIRPDGTASIEDIPTVTVQGARKVSRRIDGRGLGELVRRHCPAGSAVLVACEEVSIFGSSDAAGSVQSGSLMRTLGAIEAVFDVLRWPCLMVRPQAWQKHFGLAGKKAEKREKGQKPPAIVTALQLHPETAHLLARVKDHNRAEALLVARYAKDTLA
jgi:crossover junction endodeoxyribonuclease RuvC